MLIHNCYLKSRARGEIGGWRGGFGGWRGDSEPLRGVAGDNGGYWGDMARYVNGGDQFDICFLNIFGLIPTSFLNNLEK
jgi:hypothetical protein